MTKQLLAVLLMASITYLIRALPITLFKKKLNSKFLQSFLCYVPFAVLGAMIFPNIVYSTNNILSAVMGLVVALLVAYLEKGLMPVAISSIITVYIANLFLQ